MDERNRPQERAGERRRVAALIEKELAGPPTADAPSDAGSVRRALEEAHGPIDSWVAVVVVSDASGEGPLRIIGEDGSSPLELKGLLHDAIYAAIHLD